jgi:hypothetical protein
MTDWSRLAKLAGMLGSPHDGERLNAARLLQAALDKEGITFGDLANRISEGSGRTVYVDREVTVVERATPNPAAALAHKIIEAARQRMTTSEWRFLKDIVRSADMTNGKFALSTQQANWLTMLEKNYLAPKMKYHKPGPRKECPPDFLDSLGLGTPKDFENHVGAFRSRAAGERGAPKTKPDPRPASHMPFGKYRNDFGRGPIDIEESASHECDDSDFPPF